MKEALRQLEAWLSEEGIATGARFVNHIEYDCNWRGAFRVILREWRDKKLFEWMREGTNNTGGLGEAVSCAVKAARETPGGYVPAKPQGAKRA